MKKLQIIVAAEALVNVVRYRTFGEAQRVCLDQETVILPSKKRRFRSRLSPTQKRGPAATEQSLADLPAREIWDGHGEREYRIPLSLVSFDRDCTEHELLGALFELNLRLAGVNEAFATLRWHGKQFPAAQHPGVHIPDLDPERSAQYILRTNEEGEMSLVPYIPGISVFRASHKIVAAREILRRTR